eukprot:1845450-Amphidinium_carterae.1
MASGLSQTVSSDGKARASLGNILLALLERAFGSYASRCDTNTAFPQSNFRVLTQDLIRSPDASWMLRRMQLCAAPCSQKALRVAPANNPQCHQWVTPLEHCIGSRMD